MTGFGEARFQWEGSTFRCRVRSLNHRFLEIKTRLPRSDLFALDTAIRKKIGETFKRGAIECSLSIESNAAKADAKINIEAAQNYWQQAQALQKALQKKSAKKNTATEKLSIDTLLRLPGVVRTETPDEKFDLQTLESIQTKLLEKCIEPALGELKNTRKQEGAKLLKHFSEILQKLQACIDAIKKLEQPEKSRTIELFKTKAKETLEFLFGDKALNEASKEFVSRLHEEASFWIEKRDYEEERVRFEMHLKEVSKLLQMSEPGKKLEFYQQELLREVNTLGTKAQSAQITPHIIEMKSLIEKLKEQLANVE